MQNPKGILHICPDLFETNLDRGQGFGPEGQNLDLYVWAVRPTLWQIEIACGNFNLQHEGEASKEASPL